MASPSCLRLFAHCKRAADSRTFCTAGTNRAIRMAIMAMTTRSSIRVNAERRGMVRLLFRHKDRSVRRSGRASPDATREGSIHREVKGVGAPRLDFGGEDRMGVVLEVNAVLRQRARRPGRGVR